MEARREIVAFAFARCPDLILELAILAACELNCASNYMSTEPTENLPTCLETEADLEDALTRPSETFVSFIKSVASPLVILGAGGKMGPTLAVLARRAALAAGHPLEIIAVSRFTDPRARQWLEEREIKTLSCDLLDADALKTLPDAVNLIYLVGLKFGTAQNPAATWTMNTIVPARVAERYPRTRVVALSTGNVYPLSEVARGGSRETDALTPLGEYANAAVGRERVFEFFSQRNVTPLALLRLLYAVELRYGVLVDIARFIHAGEAVPLTNGYFNCIWQGDANEMILRSLALAASPPTVWNLCRPEIFSVRSVATRLGELIGLPVKFSGTESPTALLANASRLVAELGSPSTTLEAMLPLVASWVKRNGANLGRPTHFEVRDGEY